MHRTLFDLTKFNLETSIGAIDSFALLLHQRLHVLTFNLQLFHQLESVELQLRHAQVQVCIGLFRRRIPWRWRSLRLGPRRGDSAWANLFRTGFGTVTQAMTVSTPVCLLQKMMGLVFGGGTLRIFETILIDVASEAKLADVTTLHDIVRR